MFAENHARGTCLVMIQAVAALVSPTIVTSGGGGGLTSDYCTAVPYGTQHTYSLFSSLCLTTRTGTGSLLKLFLLKLLSRLTCYISDPQHVFYIPHFLSLVM